MFLSSYHVLNTFLTFWLLKPYVLIWFVLIKMCMPQNREVFTLHIRHYINDTKLTSEKSNTCCVRKKYPL